MGADRSSDAWRSFCDRLRAVGDLLLDDDYPASDLDRAEGYRHVANQLACWLTYALGHADPLRPVLFRSSDPVFQWGGPNADQVARRAAISGEGRYRLSGSMGCCDEFVLQVKRGATQSGGAEIDTEVIASALGLGPGDHFEITLGGEPAGGLWLPLPPDASFVHIRDYYFRWVAEEPATFVLERLDAPGGPPPRLTPDGLAAVLDAAASEIEHSIPFWNRYQARMRSNARVNDFGPPASAGRGVLDVLYSHAFVALDPDQALVVELEPPPGQLWDVQLYSRAWYEALDFRHRVTSLNHHLAHRDPDGTVRVVIAPRDPGCANWLDTEGRDEVLATFRWWHPPTTPEVRTQLLPLAGIPALRPVGPSQRRAEIEARTAHAAWRYRT